MTFITGDVIPDPHSSRSFRVIFKRGDETIVEWTVNSEAEGRIHIIVGLKEMQRRYDPDGPIRPISSR